MNQLIRCVNCNEIFLKTLYDQWPEYEYDSGSSSEFFRIIDRDDYQDFLKIHRGHQLEDLNILEDSFVSEKDYYEPVKISYFRATNGREEFVIKKLREKIGEPMRYQLISGDYSLKLLNIKIQSEEIAKQLRVEFKTTPFPESKIEAFIKLYQHIVETISIKKLERTLEESHNPLEIYYKMDDVSLFYLLRNCHNIFKGQSYMDIENFIQRHKDDGVLLLKAKYKIQITESSKTKKKPTSMVAPIEVEKIMGKK